MFSTTIQNRAQSTSFTAAFIRPENAALFKKTYPYRYSPSHHYHHSCVDTNSISDILSGIKVSWNLSKKDKVKLNRIENRLVSIAKDCIVSDEERKALNQKLKAKSASGALNLIQQLVKTAKDIPDEMAEKSEKVMHQIKSQANKSIEAIQQAMLSNK